MKSTAPKTQPDLDADLRAVARLLWRTPPQVHLAEVAFAMGAITADDYALVCAVAQAGQLDDLESEGGRAAWKVLAAWLPNHSEVPN